MEKVAVIFEAPLMLSLIILLAGRQWFIRSALISSLPDDIINETVIQFSDTPVGCSAYLFIRRSLYIFFSIALIFYFLDLAWLFELAGGAISDYEDTCVPKSQREASFTIAALHQWEMEIDDDRCIDSAEEVSISHAASSANSLLTSSQWISGTLKPVHVGGPFPSVSLFC